MILNCPNQFLYFCFGSEYYIENIRRHIIILAPINLVKPTSI
ncbi:hypothetical protein CCPUN_00050 [Cardinium endosymbiont of Culicoides punctatus]|nr:hypothetical protein CCPUN_00050 [Cardinium endosymbiont of Culicoides punctatus]